MKETVKKLYLMQLRYGGIPEDIYHFLPENERRLLAEKNGVFYLRTEQRKIIKVVLTGGVFDILHIGHIVTLEEAGKLGDVLVVAVARDDMIRKKNREPIHSQEYRQAMVGAIRYVDLAIPGFKDAKKMVSYVGPDVIAYGYDQKEFIKPEGVEIVRIEKSVDESKFKTGKILERIGL